MKKPQKQLSVDSVLIEESILTIRGQKVILDRDLAAIYGVPTKALNQAVKRNFYKFPPEFCFQLTVKELEIAVAKCDRNWEMTRTLPYAFTEHGSLMASTVLKSPRAVQMSLFIIRTFAKMRELLISQEDLQKKLLEIESKLAGHDIAVQILFNELKSLTTPKKTAGKTIGFKVSERKREFNLV